MVSGLSVAPHVPCSVLQKARERHRHRSDELNCPRTDTVGRTLSRNIDQLPGRQLHGGLEI